MKVAQIDDNLMWEEQSTSTHTHTGCRGLENAAGVLWLLAHDAQLFLSGGENCLRLKEKMKVHSERRELIYSLT
jgi:hypothetical protein